MSTSFASDFLDEKPHVLTTKSLRISPRTSLKGLGILHDISLHMKDADLSLDFPLEKLFVGIPLSGKMDLQLGRNMVTIPITQTKNLVTKPLPPLMEVMSVAPFESPESSLEKDTQLFIEEEDDFGETIELPKEEVPTWPLVELKPLPSSLCYVFLNGNTQTPVIISDKLFEEETSHLIAILEKYRSVFGYSLQDLKGISPALCMHCIPIDPASTPSREPQRRLNNAMREVMKKEVLKLLHAKIIYPVPHSD
jgi:hypothetical protein